MAQGAPIFKRITPTAVVAGTPLAVWTPTAGKRFRLMGFLLGVTVAAASVFFVEGSGNTATGVATPVIGIGATTPSVRMGDGYLSVLADNVLKADVSVNATVAGMVWGFEE